MLIEDYEREIDKMEEFDKELIKSYIRSAMNAGLVAGRMSGMSQTLDAYNQAKGDK